MTGRDVRCTACGLMCNMGTKESFCGSHWSVSSRETNLGSCLVSDTRTGYNIEPPFPLGFICVCSFRPIDVFTISACCSNLFSNKLFTVQEMGFVQWGRSVSLVLCVTNAFSLDGLSMHSWFNWKMSLDWMPLTLSGLRCTPFVFIYKSY